MKVKKGEVVIAISPNDWKVYKLAGWKRVQEVSREKIAINNEKQRLKRLARGGK